MIEHVISFPSVGHFFSSRADATMWSERDRAQFRANQTLNRNEAPLSDP